MSWRTIEARLEKLDRPADNLSRIITVFGRSKAKHTAEIERLQAADEAHDSDCSFALCAVARGRRFVRNTPLCRFGDDDFIILVGVV